MFIYCDGLEELVEICALLVREGLTFKSKFLDGSWRIELTGGY